MDAYAGAYCASASVPRHHWYESLIAISDNSDNVLVVFRVDGRDWGKQK